VRKPVNQIELLARIKTTLDSRKFHQERLEKEKLAGVIDRIDTTVDGLEVLDYKSGKYATYTLKTLENAKDFQLEFYYLLAGTLGEVTNCGFYDLNRGKIVYEPVLNEKLEKLYTYEEHTIDD